MRVISAYLLAVLGGNSSPSEADIKSILSAVGVEAEAGRIASLLKELEGKSIDDVIAEGKKSLAAMPAGGGAAAAPVAAAAGGAAPTTKKEEKKEEKPESDEDMGFSLFD